MKKLTSIVVAALAMCLCFAALSACAPEPSPTEVTKNALDAMKAQDTDALAKYYSGDISEIQAQLNAEANAAEDANSADGEAALTEIFAEKLYDFDYTIGEEAVDGDTATVGVTLNTYDFGSAFKTAMGNYITTAFGMAFTGASEEDMEAAFYKELQSEVDSLTEKSYSTDVDLALTKTDEGWKLDKFSEEATNAFTGGMFNAANEMSSNLESLQS